MKKRLIFAFLLGTAGCLNEFEIRKDPDLWHVDPKQAKHLGPPQIPTGHRPQVTDRTAWQIHTVLQGREALTDGDVNTVAISTDQHRKGEFLFVDLGCVCHFQIVRQLHPPESGSPPRFRIDTAGIHGFPYTLQFLGSGQPGETVAIFTHPVDARYFRITLIEDTAEPWSIAELEVE